jgi:hypothetical protein
MVLNKSIESRHPCLVPNLRGNDVAVNLSHVAFIVLRYIPSIPNLLEFFFFLNHERMLNFFESFFYI